MVPRTSTQIDKLSRTAETHAAAPPMMRSAKISAREIYPEQSEHQLEEEDWQARLRSLEQWIAKLLIKNEQLRMALAAARAPAHSEQEGTANGSRARAIQADEP